MKIVIHLDLQEEAALKKWARKEVRDPRSQVYLILRDELVRRGFVITETRTDPAPAAGLSTDDPAKPKKE